MSEENKPARHRILIADDFFDSRQLLAKMLQQLVDADIHEARDGAAASDEFRLVRPQITFLDIEMPARNGMLVLQEIRALDAKAFVVMVSGLSALETVRQAIALGVGGFVVKPYSAQRILDVLRKYVAETGDAAILRPR